MESLLLSANVVVPLLILMAVGVVVRKTGLVDADALSKVNRLVYHVGLPAICAKALYESDLSRVDDPGCLLFVVVGILLVFLLSFLLVPRFCSVPARRGVIIQAIVRSNDAVFGLAVATALLPADGMQTVLLAIAISVPLFNLCGVLALECNRGGRIALWPLLRKILTNPLVLGCAAGLLLNLSGLRLPAMLLSPLKSLANLATPLAFIILGAKLRFAALREDRAAIAAVTLLHLVLIPAAALAVAMLLHFSKAANIAVLSLFGAPVALSSYPLACALGGDERLAGELVAVTSAASILTMFLFITVLKQLGGI